MSGMITGSAVSVCNRHIGICSGLDCIPCTLAAPRFLWWWWLIVLYNVPLCSLASPPPPPPFFFFLRTPLHAVVSGVIVHYKVVCFVFFFSFSLSLFFWGGGGGVVSLHNCLLGCVLVPSSSQLFFLIVLYRFYLQWHILQVQKLRSPPLRSQSLEMSL